MNITHLPGSLVHRGLQVVRLPLTIVELVRHRNGDSRMALAFEAIGANVKKTIGSLVRDDSLVEEGRLENARVAELGRAQRLEAEASQQRAAADAKLDARLAEDERRREQVEHEASAKLEDAALERDRKEQQASREAAEKAEAAERSRAAMERAVDKRERAARSKKVAAERKAVSSTRKAVGAKKTVKRVDNKLKDTQAARKS